MTRRRSRRDHLYSPPRSRNRMIAWEDAKGEISIRKAACGRLLPFRSGKISPFVKREFTLNKKRRRKEGRESIR